MYDRCNTQEPPNFVLLISKYVFRLKIEIVSGTKIQQQNTTRLLLVLLQNKTEIVQLMLEVRTPDAEITYNTLKLKWGTEIETKLS